jgi:NDP-sugar pyrophosphorylase family protein
MRETQNSPGLADCCAAILAGGLGTRLRAAVPDRPKVLAELGGRPYIQLLLDQLADAGLNSVVLCTGYGGNEVRAALGAEYRQLKLAYSQESTPLGTAGALRFALSHFNSSDVLVLNGDSYCEVDLAAFFREHGMRNSQVSIVLSFVQNASRYGSVQLEADGTIARFQEKRAVNEPGWINAGIYLFRREVLERIPAGRAVSLEGETFPQWIENGVFGYRCDGRFIDIGTPESYLAAESFFAAR